MKNNYYTSLSYFIYFKKLQVSKSSIFGLPFIWWFVPLHFKNFFLCYLLFQRISNDLVFHLHMFSSLSFVLFKLRNIIKWRTVFWISFSPFWIGNYNQKAFSHISISSLKSKNKLNRVLHQELYLWLWLSSHLTSCFVQAVKDSIWLFEQEQALGFSSVSTNIRMTVIKLKSGGLWVHAPIAPTKECIQVCSFSFFSIVII